MTLPDYASLADEFVNFSNVKSAHRWNYSAENSGTCDLAREVKIIRARQN